MRNLSSLVRLFGERFAEFMESVQAPAHVLLYAVADRYGDVVQKGMVHNRLFLEGSRLVLRAVYRGESVLPAGFYGRLYSSVPQDSNTLVNLTGEPVGNGYSPQVWNRDTTDWAAVRVSTAGLVMTTGVVKTYTASGGDWGLISSFVLATTPDNTGLPFAYFVLSPSVNILDGQSFFAQPIGIVRGANL